MFRNNNHSLQSEIEQLKTTSTRLESLVEELKLEISFYKGEVKRLEWEKDIVHQDMKRMTGVFKNWMDEVHASRSARSIAQETGQFNAMVKYPCKSIADLLQLNSSTLLVTSIQAPHFVEYANKLWCQECGWNSSDILGYTCSFLQGPLTDKKVTEAFMKDLKEVGYSRMHVYNYRKNGEMFEVNITVFPVFDSISPSGPDCEVAVLTHFASVMTDMKPISNNNNSMNTNGERVKNENHNHHHNHERSETNSNDGSEKTNSESGNSNSNSGKSGETAGESSDSRESPIDSHNNNGNTTNNNNNNSNNNSHSNSTDVTTSNSSANLNNIDNNTDNSNSNNDMNNMSDQNGKLRTNSMSNGDISSSDDSSSNNGMDTSSNQESQRSNTGSNSGSTSSNSSSENSNYDRRTQSQRFEPKCVISEESFYNFGHTLRLSNLLRLMLSCNNAMILTNKDGRIIHVNTAWCKLTGYSLIDIEGKTCKFLQGIDTDYDLTKKMKDDLYNDNNTSITVYNYKKNGDKFLNKIIAVPIHGGYLEPGISHYCALLVPLNEETSQSSSTSSLLHNNGNDHYPVGMEIILNYGDDKSQHPRHHAGMSHGEPLSSSDHNTGYGSSTSKGLTEIKLPTISLLDVVSPALINPLSLSRGVISVNLENYSNSHSVDCSNGRMSGGSGSNSGSGMSSSGGSGSEGNMSESNSEHNGGDSNEDNDGHSSGSSSRSSSNKNQREEDMNNTRPKKKVRLN